MELTLDANMYANVRDGVLWIEKSETGYGIPLASIEGIFTERPRFEQVKGSMTFANDSADTTTKLAATASSEKGTRKKA